MNLRKTVYEASGAAQKGAVLAVTLSLLTILTLFALAAGQSVRTKEQTLLSMSDGKESFALAEAALRAGELQIREHSAIDAESSPGPSARQNWAASERTTESWWREHGRPVSISLQRANSAFYAIEIYGRELPVEYFRVTAATFSPHSAPVILQTVYAVQSGISEEGMNCARQSEPCLSDRVGRQSWLQLR